MGGDRKYYESYEAAERNGKLTFRCNLDEVEEINERDIPYYEEEDVFNLSYQHNCYKFFVKKKGAVKSQTRMIEHANEKLKDACNNKRSAENAIKRIGEQIEKIIDGDTSIIIF